MMGFKRYALYWAPEPGPLADFTACWLGWDALTGAKRAHCSLPGLPRPVEVLTEAPRKYGFHGTIKPPFRLAEGRNAAGLHDAAQALCHESAPVVFDGLELASIGGFMALTPVGDTAPLARLAARVVRDLDGFRAPATEAELARRRAAELTTTQENNLLRWGYPYVMGDFRFHLTLTGRLAAADALEVQAALWPLLEPILPRPFHISSLCLFGEAADGRFQLLHRYSLSG